MKNYIFSMTSFLIIIINIIFMLFFSIKITYDNSFLEFYSFYLISIGIICLINYIYIKIKCFKFNIYEIFIFLLIFLSSLSLITAIDIDVALFGSVNRYEGYFVILSYYLLFLNSLNIKEKKHIKIIVYLILFIGIINIFYGLFQIGLINTNMFSVIGSWHYAKGFLGNSMFFGTLCSICFPIVYGCFIKSKTKKDSILYFILLIIFIYGLLISGAMSSFVSLIFVIIFSIYDIVICFIKKDKNYKKEIILVIVSIVSIVGLTIIESNRNDYLKKDLIEMFYQTKEVSNGNTEDTYGTGRIYIWKETIKKIGESPLTGIGADNFKLAFNPYLIDKVSGLIVNKAHNEYLQRMLCEGLFTGITFIIFIAIIFFKNINKYRDKMHYGLFLSFISYSIQAFFNISVTRVAPLYYIIMGLIIFNNKNKD